ncbi:unnamed protein product [Diatraea saccharalis]|uniref:Lysophospholipid acyltransferase 5 n=1 Tax=Diatraea saccharalis TaxID=40085 RepID=A0A9N9QKI2_9NEOP|nr:unnamed protein product [Diatraea saccharalis]
MWGLTLSLLGYLNISPVPYLADCVGTTEPALKLLISILAAYPMAVMYHRYIVTHNNLRNIFFIIAGLDMAFYNFGLSMVHNLIPTIVIYVSTMFLPGKFNVILTFVFNMAYLLIGYIVTESEDYDITWTMPHCVLTLKLIALSFDLWDGEKMLKGNERLSETNKKTALVKAPSFSELIGFIYFPSCFLVGPIFSFRRYSDYLNDKFPLHEKHVYNKVAMKRLVQGVAYLIAFQVGVTIFNMKYMLSEEFLETSIFYRHIYCGLWAHFALYKYISCWLLTEASCIRFGLSYNGSEKDGNGVMVSQWDGCSNIKLLRFEFATKFQHYIDSFNCNTNHFAAEYIYKRLKFLGNRHLSQLFTLLFLALWHGIRSGYYMTFFNEFIIIFMEKELESIISKTATYRWLWSTYAKYPMYVLLKLYTIVFMGWSLVPFDVKVFSKWWTVYSALYFSGFLLFLPWAIVYKPLLLNLVRKKSD